jgi:hypothetical protein
MVTTSNSTGNLEGGDLYSVLPKLRGEVRTHQETQTRVEAESNTSTVALRVVGGDKKGTQCPGV